MPGDHHTRRSLPDDDHPELPLDPDTPPRPLHLRPAALIWVLGGGAIGTGLRYVIEEAWPTASGGWPWATFVINVSGAFLLGVLLEGLTLLGDDDGWRQRVRLLIGTGICGAFTTYSTFALEVSLLGRDGAIPIAIAYAAVSVVCGMASAWAGIALAGRLLRRSGAVT
jgi:fluoride exporter